ncbi:hypothetical protein BDE02_18G097700 [Populus trichocarpa]|nr:hypothetical protein BDE02_18G097700 [Populus trichocarpa]
MVKNFIFLGFTFSSKRRQFCSVHSEGKGIQTSDLISQQKNSQPSVALVCTSPHGMLGNSLTFRII